MMSRCRQGSLARPSDVLGSEDTRLVPDWVGWVSVGTSSWIMVELRLGLGVRSLQTVVAQ